MTSNLERAIHAGNTEMVNALMELALQKDITTTILAGLMFTLIAVTICYALYRAHR